MNKFIFHIANIKDWESQLNNNFYQCDSLKNEGFIHASKFDQLDFVLTKFYPNNKEIVLLKIDTEKLNSEIKWEKSELNLEPFPHIYGVINRDSIVEIIEYNQIDDLKK